MTPMVLFFDGHHSHKSLGLFYIARPNNIHLVCFPTHVKDFEKLPIETRGSIFRKEDFLSVLAKLSEKSDLFFWK